MESPRDQASVLGTLVDGAVAQVRAGAGRTRYVYYVHHTIVPQRSTGQAPALFQLCSPFPSSGCSTVAADAPRMRYLAPRVASLAAATSRYCTLLYPRLARRSPLSTRACRRPVRSRRNLQPSLALVSPVTSFFSARLFLAPFLRPRDRLFCSSNPLIPLHNSDSSRFPLV